MVSDWVNKNYDEILHITKCVVKNKNEYEDVAHEVMIMFIDNKRSVELIESGEALKYISGMVWNTYFSKKGLYYRKYNRGHNDNLELKEYLTEGVIDDEYDYEKDIILLKIEKIIREWPGDIKSWYEMTLFKMWLEKNTFSYIERYTGIPRKSISRAVNNVKNKIKEKL